MKILNKIKEYILVIIGISFIFCSIIYNVMDNNSLDVPYSTYNTRNDGAKVLYYLSKRMRYNVERFKRPAMFLPDKCLTVLIKPYVGFYSDKEQKYLRYWVEKGNTLLIAEDSKVLFDSFLFKNSVSKKRNEYFEFTLKKGKIVVVIEPKILMNKKIFLNKQNGIVFINILDSIGEKNIIFNEFYHGFGNKSINVIDILDENQFVILLQIIVAVILFLYTKSKRFGKPSKIMDLDSRIENENIFALSNILVKSKADLIVLNVYSEMFIKDIKRCFDLQNDDEILLKSDIIISGIRINDILIKVRDLLDKNNKLTKNNKNRVNVINLIKQIELVRREINDD